MIANWYNVSDIVRTRIAAFVSQTLTCGARPEKVDNQYGTTGDEYKSTLTLCFPDVALKQLEALGITRGCELDDFGTLLRVARIQVELDDLRSR